MRESILNQRHANQILLGRLDAFLDRQRNFARFARPESDVAGFIADHDQRRKRKVLTTLHDLGDAVDRNDLILQIQSLWSDSLLRLSHYSSFDLASFAGFALGFFGFAAFASVASGSPPSLAPTVPSAGAAASTASSLLRPAARAASVRARTRP